MGSLTSYEEADSIQCKAEREVSFVVVSFTVPKKNSQRRTQQKQSN